MSHVRQQIRDRIATDLTGLTGIGTNVYKMRRYALDDAKLPAIAIYTMDETSNLITIGVRTIRRVLNVGVEIFAKGSSTTVYDTMDGYCVSVEEALANDFSLNGLAKSCVLTSSSIDVNVEGEKAVCTARLVFAVEYITAINDVETAR
jgi:hypothetical protein